MPVSPESAVTCATANTELTVTSTPDGEGGAKEKTLKLPKGGAAGTIAVVAVLHCCTAPVTNELPEGLCGPALKGPAWSYYRTGPGLDVDILVERSPFGYDTFRAPARVIATFDIR
ncbi:hypothetical protein ACWCRF_11730 [Streptomyces sp. NPDC002405]|uniref:hypothetical protein n=1 Tax=Streptomyces sp. NPDC001231 TaxID=3364549 RepID=UPI0036AA8E5F